MPENHFSGKVTERPLLADNGQSIWKTQPVISRGSSIWRRGNCQAPLPASSLEAGHGVEVLIATEDGQPMLERQCRDPGVVGRNRAA